MAKSSTAYFKTCEPFKLFSSFTESSLTRKRKIKMFSTHTQSTHWDNQVDSQQLKPNAKFVNVSLSTNFNFFLIVCENVILIVIETDVESSNQLDASQWIGTGEWMQTCTDKWKIEESNGSHSITVFVSRCIRYLQLGKVDRALEAGLILSENLLFTFSIQIVPTFGRSRWKVVTQWIYWGTARRQNWLYTRGGRWNFYVIWHRRNWICWHEGVLVSAQINEFGKNFIESLTDEWK